MITTLPRKRVFKDSNYHAVYCDGKTIRMPIDPSKDITELEYPEFYDVKITSYCTGKCPWCFLPGTPVNTSNGDIPIEALKLNDVVLGKTDTQETISQNVEQLFERDYNGEIINIELENGVIIPCTPNHKFFTQNRGWVEAQDLTEEELLEI
jgi:hypothetical protein